MLYFFMSPFFLNFLFILILFSVKYEKILPLVSTVSCFSLKFIGKKSKFDVKISWGKEFQWYSYSPTTCKEATSSYFQSLTSATAYQHHWKPLSKLFCLTLKLQASSWGWWSVVWDKQCHRSFVLGRTSF